MHVNIRSFFIEEFYTFFFCGQIFYTLCVVYLHGCLYILQRGAMFVVMVRVVQIKGVRMLVEHLIATLPDRKVRRSSPRLQPVRLGLYDRIRSWIISWDSIFLSHQTSQQ